MATAPLRYYGGKSKLGRFLADCMSGGTTYVQCHNGLGSPYWELQSVYDLIVLNDRDERIGILFRVIRDHPEELARRLALTPFSRSEHGHCSLIVDRSPDEIERARAFCVLLGQGFAGKDNTHAGDRTGRSTLKRWSTLPDRILECAEALRRVRIECRRDVDVIADYDSAGTVFFADPPYLEESLKGKNEYRYGMSRDEHIQLLDALVAAKGRVLLTHYASNLYREKLRGWFIRPIRRVQLASQQRAVTTECLWANYDFDKRLRIIRSPYARKGSQQA